jgi:hypothetical protein
MLPAHFLISDDPDCTRAFLFLPITEIKAMNKNYITELNIITM